MCLTDFVSLVDFRAPKEPVYWDTTATACAACGLLQIAEMVPEYEKPLYFDSGVKMLTALEVLSAAVAVDGILNEDERELAYGYSVKLMNRMVDFWYDTDMESINMWEKGRKTDNYRNKNRILGENLSLCMQMVNSFEHWRRAGMKTGKSVVIMPRGLKD